MAFLFGRVRGMRDVLPPDSRLWEKVELVMRKCASFYGFSYVRTPVLEFTELFDRSVGDSSDIVQKEMYTFNDKAGRSVTMRPEFTAGVLRAVSSALTGDAVYPLKCMYFGPCYRYEKPQAGRYREFFQFGVEVFGGKSNLADLEIICVANKIFQKLGINNVRLEINAVGCANCREKYLIKIKEYFSKCSDALCETCCRRLQTNPLRIFDCKNEDCRKLFDQAPRTIDFICSECADDFENLKQCLDQLNISYKVNTKIVRGLDYYTKLVFEFIANFNGNDLTVCGGGRYDGLSQSLGGTDLPATGFGIGVDRIVELVKNNDLLGSTTQNIGVYVATVDDASKLTAVNIVSSLRNLNIKSDYDIVGRGLKAQMRYADKMGYKYVVVLGSNEISTGVINLKNMSDGTVRSFDLLNFPENFRDCMN